MKDCLRIVIVLLLMVIGVESFSQRRYDTVLHVSNYPVKNGYVCVFNPGSRIICPGNTISIFSKDSCVFAVMEGKLKKIFNVEETENVLACRGETFVLYGNMDKIYKNVGDTIHKGELIGTIRRDTTDNRYELYFQIESRRKSLVYADQIKFLRRIH